MVEEMLVTGDEYISLANYVASYMVDICNLSSFQNVMEVINQLGLVFRDSEVRGVQIRYIQLKRCADRLYQGKGLNLGPNRAFAFAMPSITSI